VHKVWENSHTASRCAPVQPEPAPPEVGALTKCGIQNAEFRIQKVRLSSHAFLAPAF